MVARLRPNDRFISARTAEEGIAIIHETHPDLVLMDISLPGMDGYEALSELKQHAGTRHITVIAVSAHAMHNDVSNGIAAGFDDYITKPVDMGNLNGLLNEYLSNTEMHQFG